ncbi:hypothetical protein Btru_063764 [Bulinus truncatus]|nr:hypothetical protein Btru_063764 [Bulinus truncatus]
MPSLPILMVLYSSDALEIRYSDGSRLELSPCGSTMIYHPTVLTAEHPRYASKSVHKRTIFVTSEHRSKVLQALDFRNRFAERPYLSKELLSKEDIIALYAKIDRIAWPKDLGKANVEILPDGSRRITSLDDYASLIVSPHGQDFTVCYLSQISTEKTSKKIVLSNSVSSLTTLAKHKDMSPSKEMSPSREPKPKEAIVRPFEMAGTYDKSKTQSNVNPIQKAVEKSTNICSASARFTPSEENQHSHPTDKIIVANTSEKKLQNELGHFDDMSCDSFSRKVQFFKNQEVITEPHLRTDSPTAHELSSISRSSTPDGLRMAIDSDATLNQDSMLISQAIGSQRIGHVAPPHFTSSPNEEIAQHQMKIKNSQSLDGSFLELCTQKVSSGLATLENSAHDELKDKTGSGSCSNTLEDNSMNRQKLNDIDNDTTVTACRLNFEAEGEPKTMLNSGLPERMFPNSFVPLESLDGATSSEQSKEKRLKYTWLTIHASRNDCPAEWIVPLKLALEGRKNLSSETSTSSSSVPSMTRLQAVSATFRGSERDCNFTNAPHPLPLFCPYQHKHRMLQNVESPQDQDSAGDFQHGRLKVVLSEGIVYRLIQKGELQTIEIHPGDGSVLVSQGIQAHFFTHYILVGDKVEERTYSLKSLPPVRLKCKYNIENLIKTAIRFFLLNTQWEKRGLKEITPCWKKDVVAVVEPLSTSLLEDCTVEGLGKFSAFSNGRIRIVFIDRTALDMFCNFSNRMNDHFRQASDLQTSLGASVVVPVISSTSSNIVSSYARLLLPSGKYVTVDINCPGIYRRYIQAAQDWASWVSSCPGERQEFFKQHQSLEHLQKAAELELKKIFCFNYIVDQTLQIQNHVAEQSHDETNHERHDAMKRLTHSFPEYSEPASKPKNIAAENTQMPFPSLYGSLSNPHSKPERQTLPMKNDSLFRGIHDVRQILLQNSNLINEIDSFLEKTKKS